MKAYLLYVNYSNSESFPERLCEKCLKEKTSRLLVSQFEEYEPLEGDACDECGKILE